MSEYKNIAHYVRGIPIEEFGTDRRGPVRRKLVLLLLSTYANPDGTGAWPSQERLSQEAGCSERALRSILGWLQENHHLTIRYKAHRVGKSAVKVNEYVIHTRQSVLPGLESETPGSYKQDTRKQLALVQPEVSTSSNHHRPPKEEERAPLPDGLKDGDEFLERCWTDYLTIFGKVEWMVKNEKNRTHLRGLLAHLRKLTSTDQAVRALFNFAMEELSKDDWITGKSGKGKHDFPEIVFQWDRVQEYLDKAEGVTVD